MNKVLFSWAMFSNTCLHSLPRSSNSMAARNCLYPWSKLRTTFRSIFSWRRISAERASSSYQTWLGGPKKTPLSFRSWRILLFLMLVSSRATEKSRSAQWVPKNLRQSQMKLMSRLAMAMTNMATSRWKWMKQIIAITLNPLSLIAKSSLKWPRFQKSTPTSPEKVSLTRK